MDNEYLKAKEINEKQLAVESIIEFTLNGSIIWGKQNNTYIADYHSHLNNHIEFESYTSQQDNNLTMSKIIIKNENGKKTIYNSDISSDMHRRLFNAVNNQLKESNILQDFL